VEMAIKDQKFLAKGLTIMEKNYLDVYIYEEWKQIEIPDYKPQEIFIPSSVVVEEGSPDVPSLLTEYDLIGLMDEHGHGIDAVYGQHIETIQQRGYISIDGDRLIPTYLGLSLYDAYMEIAPDLMKCHRRAQLQRDLQDIINGIKDSQAVIDQHIDFYETVYYNMLNGVEIIRQHISKNLRNCRPGQITSPCPLPMNPAELALGDMLKNLKKEPVDSKKKVKAKKKPNISKVKKENTIKVKTEGTAKVKTEKKMRVPKVKKENNTKVKTEGAAKVKTEKKMRNPKVKIEKSSNPVTEASDEIIYID